MPGWVTHGLSPLQKNRSAKTTPKSFAAYINKPPLQKGGLGDR